MAERCAFNNFVICSTTPSPVDSSSPPDIIKISEYVSLYSRVFLANLHILFVVNTVWSNDFSTFTFRFLGIASLKSRQKRSLLYPHAYSTSRPAILGWNFGVRINETPSKSIIYISCVFSFEKSLCFPNILIKLVVLSILVTPVSRSFNNVPPIVDFIPFTSFSSKSINTLLHAICRAPLDFPM